MTRPRGAFAMRSQQLRDQLFGPASMERLEALLAAAPSLRAVVHAAGTVRRLGESATDKVTRLVTGMELEHEVDPEALETSA